MKESVDYVWFKDNLISSYRTEGLLSTQKQLIFSFNPEWNKLSFEIVQRILMK